MQHRHGDVDPEEAALVPRPELNVVVHQRPDKGVGPAGDDGEAAAVGDGVGRGGGPVDEVVGGEVFVGVGDPDEVVGDAAAFVVGDLVGDDVEAPVDLHFVGVDDLSVETGGEVDGEAGFSGAGGAHHNDHLVLAALAGDDELVHVDEAGRKVDQRLREMVAGGGE